MFTPKANSKQKRVKKTQEHETERAVRELLAPATLLYDYTYDQYTISHLYHGFYTFNSKSNDQNLTPNPKFNQHPYVKSKSEVI
ncbi:hypothetical protein MTR_7g089335 [Medicago truncatula]|uniref:Uncharacterized protein n=1 Tax=Medicago truncatula TaxID=3880 RepID=A0A072U1N4_MEDTR|nr:hypothetical protein MTR_7g089335 [Medicago truncatula]